MTKKCCPMLCSCARILLLLLLLQKVVYSMDTTFLISIEECTKKILIRKTLDERFTREDWKKKNLEEEEEEDFYSPSRRRHTFSFLVRTKNEIVVDERESNPQSSPSSVT